MSDFEKRKGRGKGSKEKPEKKVPEIKRPRDEDFTPEELAAIKAEEEREKELNKELYLEKLLKSTADKAALLEKLRSGHDPKKPIKTPEELDLEKLDKEFKALITRTKIEELRKKIAKESAPPKEKTPEELEYEHLVKMYEAEKKRAEAIDLRKKIEALENARKPKEKTALEKEYEALEKELKKLEEIHKIENLKAKIAEAREKVTNKAKYLNGAASGMGGWLNFLNPFRTDTSKHVSIGAVLGIGLLCGALPLLMIGGLMALIPSNETKAKAVSK